MKYELSEVHIEAAKVQLDKVGPCTLLDLAGQLQSESICSDLNKVFFVQQLQKLVDSGVLDASKILRSRLIKGLTTEQKLLIKEITENILRRGEIATLDLIAQQIVNRTGKETVEHVKKQLSFLLMPLHSLGDSDEEETSGKG